MDIDINPSSSKIPSLMDKEDSSTPIKIGGIRMSTLP